MLPSTWRGFAVALARKAARIRRVWRARSPSLSAGFSLSLSLSFSVRVHLQLSGCRRGCEHILEKVCPWSVLLISINCFIWVGGLLPRVIDLTFVIVLKLLKPTSSWIFLRVGYRSPTCRSAKIGGMKEVVWCLTFVSGHEKLLWNLSSWSTLVSSY